MIRSLLFPPKLLLLDEVTSGLDPRNTEIVESAIERLHTSGITILSITHNEAQSLRCANRRIIMVNGSIDKEEIL
ncbi:MAG: ABC transporter ATP-binding protein [Veillonella caviae]|uniref:ATP-binding cassette domain-containing protein n=1 Tax=Veillonella caviae TaxID=248316 RepID=UPI002A909E68|nr:ABC transporter ATP-binding protein [Veillonella caviae]MDY5481679.1 ABC transporter ATP-binding protein [Veillonella caviae]